MSSAVKERRERLLEWAAKLGGSFSAQEAKSEFNSLKGSTVDDDIVRLKARGLLIKSGTTGTNVRYRWATPEEQQRFAEALHRGPTVPLSEMTAEKLLELEAGLKNQLQQVQAEKARRLEALRTQINRLKGEG